MSIASKFRKQGICIYLLYMWQVEDVLRAFAFDVERIEKEYITRFPESERKEEMKWLKSVIGMMKKEACQEKGHLKASQNTLHQLEDFHYELLNSGKYPWYSATYYKALPHIAELRARGNQNKHEIEISLEALYCFSLLRMQKRKASKETHRVIKLITAFLQTLSDAHLKWEKGELKL